MGRRRIYASAAERQRAYRERKKQRELQQQQAQLVQVAGSKAIPAGTRIEDLLEMSVEQLHETGLKDTTIKFILQKQYELREAMILNDKERQLEESINKLMEAIQKIVIKHGLEEEFFKIVAPDLPAGYANPWQG